MLPYYNDERGDIYCGDCVEAMKELPENSVNSVITDPPYNLGFMNKGWDKTGIANNIEMWKEVLRILKPGGYLLSFGGTRTYHRMVCAIEDAGFEIRDMIEYIYGSGFPKSLNIGKKLKQWEGWGTTLKPAHEPIVVARKPLSEKNVALNVLKWGTGGININESRIGTEIRINKGMSKNKPQGAGTFRDDNWQPKDVENIAQGRFPANLILECICDEVIEGKEEIVSIHDAPVGTFAGGEPNRGSIKNYRERNVGKSIIHTNPECPCYMLDEFSSNASRFFYVAKASRSERNRRLEEFEPKQRDENRKEGNPGGDNPRNRGVKKVPNNHPTVKPIKLMEYLVRLVTPSKGRVLDPFLGSGTTAIACKKLGFNYIGIEKEKEYCDIAVQRLKAVPQTLF